MPDDIFASPRRAAIYDALDPDRSDLDAYVRITAEYGARRVLDLGCGTGSFAVMLAARGIDAVGVDPAGASLDVARAKPGAERVRWIHGTAAALPELSVDLAVMTANVAQVFLTDEDFTLSLRGIRGALHPRGRLVFEVRDPARQAWLGWNREQTFASTVIDGVGRVDAWCDLLSVVADMVSFRWSHAFATDGQVVTSDSMLRFRDRAAVVECLDTSGFVLEDVREAPDRPGRELVFIASVHGGHGA